MKLNNDDFWPKNPDSDINEVMENKSKSFTYEELFNMSYHIDESVLKNYMNWNLFSVSDVNNIEQIFHDIAHSKKARSIYRKVNIYNILRLIFEILLISFFIFGICGTFISLNHTFLLKTKDWFKILYSSFFCWLYFLLRNNDYIPVCFDKILHYNYSTNKIWRSYISHYKRPRNSSVYHIYKAINGQNYLTKLNYFGRYYTMRNWYLISKHIVLKKISIDDLFPHYHDNLFFYLNNKDFKEDKLKIRCFFSLKFSLHFLVDSKFISNLFLVFIPFISIIIIGIISYFFGN